MLNNNRGGKITFDVKHSLALLSRKNLMNFLGLEYTQDKSGSKVTEYRFFE